MRCCVKETMLLLVQQSFNMLYSCWFVKLRKLSVLKPTESCVWLLQSHPYCYTIVRIHQLETFFGINSKSVRNYTLCLLLFPIRAALSSSEVTSCLLEHLQLVDVNKNPTQGLKVICLSNVVPCFETLTCLCEIMISSHISSLVSVAERTAFAMLNGN